MFKKIMILIIALVCLLSVSAISATDNNTAGDNVTVDNTDESFYVLQDEIANAYEKGTLELERNYINTGGFPDGITINNSITIDGKGHTIDGKNNGRIFNINTNVVNVTLKNINFINGKVTSKYSQMLYGGAIFVVKSGSSLTVINSTFTNTTAQYSGGAISSAGKVTVINSTFTNTRAEYDGGAIYCYGGVNVTNSSFTNTTSVGYGGAIYNTNRGSVTLTNSSFTNTSSGSYGGAIYCITVTVTNSSFTNTTVINTGASRGGAILSYMDATVVDSKFKDCKAKSGSDISSMSGSINLICNDYDGKNKYNSTEVNGNVNKYIISGTFAEVEYRINETEDKGVLNLENKKYTAIDNDTTINVNKNITINGQGATLDADKRFRIMNIVNGMSVTLKNINFINGNSSTSGGAIYSISDSLTVTNSSFTNNTAAIYGGAIFTYYEISVTNSSFTNNTANSGYGGAIGSYRSNITVTNSNFTNNTANNGYGGAIGSYGGNITVTNSNFTNNTAYCGGTICKASIGSVTVTNSNFINTTSFTEGGAICSEGNVSVINSTFTNTKASNVGGAIIGYSSSVSVINSTFTNTSAGSDGGAIFNYHGNIFVSNSNFINNSAKGNGGSIRAEGSLNVKDSTFNSPNANGTVVIYQSSASDVNLTNNTIQSNLLAIYNNGSIVSPTSLTFDNVNVNIGENATLTATLTDDKGNIIGSSNPVTGKVNGTPITFIFDKTTRKFTAIYNQTAVEGKYPVSGTYSKASDCTVNNGTLYVGEVAELTAPSIVKYYKNGTQFIVKITENGLPLPGSHVEITLNGVTYNRTTDVNGIAKLNINLAPGEYDVNVGAVGSFGELTTNSTITVLSTIEGNDTVLFYRNGTKYNAIFLDSQGNPLNNTRVTFNINGVTYTRTTNENGTTSGLNINLNPGEYIITATNTANGEMHSNNITVLPTIEANNLVKYYRNSSQFVVKALDKQGQAIAGQTVKFNINGVIYTKTTDDNGEAKLNINLAAGNSEPEIYVITTECNGCTVSNSIIVLPVIIGEDFTAQYHSGEKYNVFVLDGQGNPQEGVNITLNINGLNYHRTSNIEGTTTGLTINLQPGKYIITAIRDDNGATISNNVVVTE